MRNIGTNLSQSPSGQTEQTLLFTAEGTAGRNRGQFTHLCNHLLSSRSASSSKACTYTIPSPSLLLSLPFPFPIFLHSCSWMLEAGMRGKLLIINSQSTVQQKTRSSTCSWALARRPRDTSHSKGKTSAGCTYKSCWHFGIEHYGCRSLRALLI